MLGKSRHDKKMFDSFVKDFCYIDGVFIFSILRRNSNFIATSEIVCALWLKYLNENLKKMLDEQNQMSENSSISRHEFDLNETLEKISNKENNIELIKVSITVKK